MANKRLLIVLVLLCFVITIFGCKADKETSVTKDKTEIKISGSGTCLPLVKILSSEYEKENPDIKFTYLPSVHSSGGIKGVANNTLDVGTVSRELKSDEKKYELKYYLISNDPVAVGTHKGVNIKNLSTEQIRSIYSGKITNWKEVGGINKRIKVLDRNEDESAKIILRMYIIGKDLEITKDASNLYFEDDMINALINTPYSIGYFSYGFVKSEKLPINVISVDDLYPTAEADSSMKYDCLRPLGIVTRQQVNPEIKDFIDYIYSEKGKKVMIENYFNPGF